MILFIIHYLYYNVLTKLVYHYYLFIFLPRTDKFRASMIYNNQYDGRVQNV